MTLARTRPSTAAVVPSMVLLLSNTNLFAALRDLEEQNGIKEGSAERRASFFCEHRLKMKLYVFLALVGTALAATNFEKQCAPKAVVGFCKAKLPRWWFNVETGKCEHFYYGGCGGNENRYLTQEKCEETCLKTHAHQKSQVDDKAYIAITDNIVPAAVASVCRKPPFSGPCKGSFPRFYYDQKTNTCRPFVYGGCQSNGNNFESPIDCMRFCGTVKPGEPVPY